MEHGYVSSRHLWKLWQTDQPTWRTNPQTNIRTSQQTNIRTSNKRKLMNGKKIGQKSSLAGTKTKLLAHYKIFLWIYFYIYIHICIRYIYIYMYKIYIYVHICKASKGTGQKIMIINGIVKIFGKKCILFCWILLEQILFTYYKYWENQIF